MHVFKRIPSAGPSLFRLLLARCQCNCTVIFVPQMIMRDSHMTQHQKRDSFQFMPHPYPTIQVQPKRGAKSKAPETKKKSDPPTTQAIQLDPTICSGVNIMKNGTDPPIKPDSEYPEWLWSLAEGGQSPISHTQVPPDTKQYWRRFNKEKAHERNTLTQQLGRS